MLTLMNERLATKWPVIDALASSLGASQSARLKWRSRGVPYRWQVILIGASKGSIRPEDFARSSSQDRAA